MRGPETRGRIAYDKGRYQSSLSPARMRATLITFNGVQRHMITSPNIN
jgi:hypothetical protein